MSYKYTTHTRFRSLHMEKSNNVKYLTFLNWLYHFSSVQLLSHVQLFATLWTTARQASLSITNSGVHPNPCPLSQWCHPTSGCHLIFCHPLFLLPSIFPSIRVFSNESVLRIRWPKYWSFSFNISPSNEHAGLISFRMDWLDLLAVQGTLKSLLQHHSSKASILLRSAFFMVKWYLRFTGQNEINYLNQFHLFTG